MTEMMNKELSRKTFLKGGGVMIVGFSAFAQAASAANGTTPFSQRGPGDCRTRGCAWCEWLSP